MHVKALRLGLALCALSSLMVLAGCNEHPDRIRDINNNPDAYAHRDVTIAGEVTDVSPEVPFLDLAAYRVNDDTGSIWIVSHSGAPLKGDKVGVKGRVEEAFKFGDTALGTL